MFRSHLLVALRSLRRNRSQSIINISGLTIGMAIAVMIGLWINDELNFDHFTPHCDRIAQIRQNQTHGGAIKTAKAIPIPLAAVLRKDYATNFKNIVLASWTWNHVLSIGDKHIFQSGAFMEAGGPTLFGMTMLNGSRDALNDPGSILLSRSTAQALFGDADPMNKIVSLDNKAPMKVAGIYQDFPYSSSFRENSFLASWVYYLNNQVSKSSITDWGENSFQLFVEIADNTSMAAVTAKIKDIKLNHVDKDDRKYNPQLLLQPMTRWHLYGQFVDGVDKTGRIQYVWLFGITGIFVLLLACINFMNLSTARSERRAREVGIRKAIGSLRGQLVGQFFTESILVAVIAFAFAIVLVALLLPAFNQIADKKMEMPWLSPLFWIAGCGFAFLTGMVAGSYPALYLSSFKPVKVLKGVFKAGPQAAIPRKILVVLQFSVSVILIIGTIVVFRQIQFARNRPVGYSREGLINAELATNDIAQHFDAFRNDCKEAGLASEMALATSSTMLVTSNVRGVEWKGKAPDAPDDFANIGVSVDYGQTIGWKFVSGRDFSRSRLTDSFALVLNETAVKYMGLTNPVGETIRWWGKDYHVIGVVKDMVVQSPYEPVKQALYHLEAHIADDFLNIRINPNISSSQAIAGISEIYKRYSPGAPFTYQFADLQYGRKFEDENRIGRLAAIFSILAIFISCLGLFGMASFLAEQRVKEIGVRKVLGASVVQLWGMLSKDFVMLTGIALLVGIPVAYSLMGNWLQNYSYRVGLPWWIFALTAGGAFLITLATVSYQGIRAAMANPVKSLRSE